MNSIHPGLLLGNPFEAVIVVAPEKNLTAKEDEKLAKKLQLIKLPCLKKNWRNW